MSDFNNYEIHGLQPVPYNPESSRDEHPVRNTALAALALTGALYIADGQPVKDLATGIEIVMDNRDCLIQTGEICPPTTGPEIFDYIDNGRLSELKPIPVPSIV
jgi:hypothetical protein